jgi:hypothetical protein
MAADFRKYKLKEYKTLTNIGPSNFWQETFVKHLFKEFKWNKTIMLFDKGNVYFKNSKDVFIVNKCF